MHREFNYFLNSVLIMLEKISLIKGQAHCITEFPKAFLRDTYWQWNSTKLPPFLKNT